MYQTNDLNENGKPIVYPRMMLEGKSTTEHMAEYISEASSFTTGEVKGVLEMMANFLAQEMANGRSVKLDGIGVFSPSLGLAKGKEEDEVAVFIDNYGDVIRKEDLDFWKLDIYLDEDNCYQSHSKTEYCWGLWHILQSKTDK